MISPAVSKVPKSRSKTIFLSIVRGILALGSLLAIRSKWIELYAVTREPMLACDDSDHAEKHAEH
jgi:hypothetical protein